MVSSWKTYISFAPRIIRELKKKATKPKTRELAASKILMLREDNLVVK